MWDEFLHTAKNGIFLFYRHYMEYHAQRFQDNSLMAYEEDRLIAILPANIKHDVLYSHEGLTFGGWITGVAMTSKTMVQIFIQLEEYLVSLGINKLIYKCIPYIYHTCPASEDIFALTKRHSIISRCSITSTIDLLQPYSFSKRRKRGIAKAKKNALKVKETGDLAMFYRILETRLQEKYNTLPTHTLEELASLVTLFPNNIRLFATYDHDVMLAGTIIYESQNVAHVQYIASNEAGRDFGALDLLFEWVIHHYKNKKYFDFGTSDDAISGFPNENLIKQKEEFGASAIAVLTFEVPY